MARPFLTAAWRDLLLLNWRVDPAQLAPHVPAGTELDPWDGGHYVSVVGFRFLDLTVKGLPAIGHRDFPEVNLRFYVRHEVNGEVRRGVVFLREVTPHCIVQWVARTLYNEPYETLPMRANITTDRFEFSLKQANQWRTLAAQPTSPLRPPEPMETFFVEHYWGYNQQPDSSTMKYEVKHPKWQVRSAELAQCDLDLEALYGKVWAEALAGEPDSVFIADGSEVAVFSGTMI